MVSHYAGAAGARRRQCRAEFSNLGGPWPSCGGLPVLFEKRREPPGIRVPVAYSTFLPIVVNLQQGSESSGFRHISGIFCCYSHDKCVPIWASSHCLPQLPRAAPERLRQRLLPQNLRPKHLLRTLGLQTSQNKTKKKREMVERI